MRKAIVFSGVVFAVCAALLTGVGCANIIPPTGGPRDSLPPVLVKSTPPDSTVNFRGKSITFQFDEYLADLQNIQNNLIFTPTFRKNPVLEVRAKNLTVKFQDTLEKNTTYVLSFGDAIADANETNVLHGFTYTFSTGPVLDSLELSGRVVLAETGGIDTNMIAILHRSLVDSAVFKQRPLYAVKLDGTGRFHFKNLPADTFALYVVSNTSYGKQYKSNAELFAFSDSAVVAGKSDSLLLYAYREVTKAATNPPLSSLRPGNSERRLRFTLPNGEQDLRENYTISFPVPLKIFDSSKIHLYTDSIYNAVAFSSGLDSTRKQLQLKTAWKENTAYNLVLEKEFATDTNGKQLLKTDTLFFTTRKLADYGKVVIRFRNLNLDRKPVLQVVQNNLVTLSVPLTTASYSQALFLPGEYSLRILYDTNGNGKWDPGKFFNERRQPEIVEAVKQNITVKAAWDNEFDIVL